MASTFITRVCDDELLTSEEAAAVAVELGKQDGETLKLAIAPLVAVAGEVIVQRMPPTAMLTWLAQAEYIDALALIQLVQNGAFKIDDVARLFALGEFGIYTPTQIEFILGL